MHITDTSRFPMGLAAAIDVGSGNTKLAYGDNGDAYLDLFPSIALQYEEADSVDSDHDKTADDVFRVVVNGVSYKVGKDIKASRSKGRIRGEKYCETPEYMALHYGAFAYMLKKAKLKSMTIPVLVVGLPITTLNRYKSKLEADLVGVHQINDELSVNVQRCIVRAQPRGGYDYVRSTAPADIKAILDSSAVLTIDPGYNTLDFLFTEEGKGLPEYSGAFDDFGQSTLLDRVGAAMARDLGVLEQTFLMHKDKVDVFLRTGKPIIFDGNRIDNRVHYLGVAQGVAKEFLTLMFEKIKEMKGFIELFNLVGGSNHVYEPLLNSMFGEDRVLTTENSEFAVVRGYLLAGNVALKAAQTANPAADQAYLARIGRVA